MLIFLSPSKTMSFAKAGVPEAMTTIPLLLTQAEILAELLKSMSINEIRRVMEVSTTIAESTMDRFRKWSYQHNISNSEPALLTFSGDVYDGLNAGTFNEKDFAFAQKHLLIFSGLYGVLRAMDLMMLYRLELGIKWKSERFNNLYEFWKHHVNDIIAGLIMKDGSKTIVNLASYEYFKIIDTKMHEVKVVSPAFMELKGSQLKMVSIYAKKARGMMARFIIKNKLENPKKILLFNEDGYEYIESESSPEKPVFVR